MDLPGVFLERQPRPVAEGTTFSNLVFVHRASMVETGSRVGQPNGRGDRTHNSKLASIDTLSATDVPFIRPPSAPEPIAISSLAEDPSEGIGPHFRSKLQRLRDRLISHVKGPRNRTG